MNSVDYIKNRIQEIYRTDPHIHIRIKTSHSRSPEPDRPAVIKEIYPNIFRVEENDDGCTKYLSVQYAEILMGQVEILELGPLPKNRK